MFNTYVKEEKKKKSSTYNLFLRDAIKDVAKKYNVIKHKKNGAPIVLYDFKKNEVNQRKTIRFIAQQASSFIYRIPDSQFGGVNASKYASSRQIRFLLYENSGRTTVNSIMILCVIFKLLQYDTNCEKYKEIIHESARKDAEYTDYSPDKYLSSQREEPKNCAEEFLGKRLEKILRNDAERSLGQQSLADYICACSDYLDNIVTDDAYIAIHYKQNNEKKRKEFKDINPDDFPAFPSR